MLLCPNPGHAGTMFSCSRLDKSRQRFHPWHLEVLCARIIWLLDHKSQNAQGQQSFFVMKSNVKSLSLWYSEAAAHHIRLKPWTVCKETTQILEVQRRQQAWPYCLLSSVSLKQLCSWFGSTNTKIRMTKRLAWSLQNCYAFPVSDQKEDQIFTQKEDSEKGGRDRRKGERDKQGRGKGEGERQNIAWSSRLNLDITSQIDRHAYVYIHEWHTSRRAAIQRNENKKS